ncbi:DUF4263 domain-containing protein [Tumebacillus sp. ITR2]|uniref:DUF4263 domain-containing protein n=1 Tax=Tumebacillus amylolyticus TaxID=2801339 RepID=A0ABS1J698_9BACL|nr:Shedu anti-phage system protein SduA domain-containing protein [Tumebacillus amylolyticus]MBL0385784.1 DUF4263 domain-containing protein [Tumebacillus amylolyticus]
MQSNTQQHANRYTKITLDIDALDTQIKQYEQLLIKNEGGVLHEQVDILPFFKRSAPLLSCLIPSWNSWATGPYLYRFELPLYGQMRPDLTVLNGDTIYFIEFEDALPSSIFSGKKLERDFADRYNHGFSQITDWFWRVEYMNPTDKNAWFGQFQNLKLKGILVIGRDRFIQDSNELARLQWRSNRVLVDSKAIEVVTYDTLLTSFKGYQAGILDAAAMRSQVQKT